MQDTKLCGNCVQREGKHYIIIIERIANILNCGCSVSFPYITHLNPHNRDFPGGRVVKNPSAIAGDTGLIPGPGIPHAMEQVSPCAATAEPAL